MEKKILLWILFLLYGICIISCNQADNKLSKSEKEKGWNLLFDGKTLNGWRDYQGEGVKGPWKVEDELLAAQGKGSDSTGYLISKGQYENFILTFNWKTSEFGNSGVFYHVVERPQYKVPYVTGPEYQVLDEIGFPRELKEWQLTGADYAMYAPDKNKKQLKKAWEWNSSKIVFDNGHVEHWSARPGEKGMDNNFCQNPQETIDYMQGLDEPWIASKVMAAGAITPEEGFKYAFENGADFVCAGMYDFQVVEDANIALNILNSDFKDTRKRRWLV